jgi:hypothetical protein
MKNKFHIRACQMFRGTHDDFRCLNCGQPRPLHEQDGFAPNKDEGPTVRTFWETRKEYWRKPDDLAAME